MCVCACVCMYACVWEHVRVCVCVCVYVCVHVCESMCIRARLKYCPTDHQPRVLSSALRERILAVISRIILWTRLHISCGFLTKSMALVRARVLVGFSYTE